MTHQHRKTSAIRVILLAALVLPSIGHAADRYIIDSDQSFVRVAAKMCEPDILKGEFGTISGEIMLDEAQLANSSIALTISTGDVVFDHEFHRSDNIKDIATGEKILNVMKFPIATFKSTHITRGTEQEFSSYKETSKIVTAIVKGDLTLVGITRPFEIEVTFHESTGRTDSGRIVAAFSASGSFKRSDFGVMYGLDRIGIRRMGDDVTVLASITANRAQ